MFPLLRPYKNASDDTSRTVRVALSRWRHGFEPRTGCQEVSGQRPSPEGLFPFPASVANGSQQQCLSDGRAVDLDVHLANAGRVCPFVDITARVTRAAGDEGVLIATGNENSGLSVFVQGGRLVVDYNAFGDHTLVESTLEVPAGDCTLSVHMEREVSEGWVEVAIDGTTCGRAAIPLYLSTFTSVGASVGEDHGSAVSARYTAPFAFTGTLHDVTIQLPGGRDPKSDEAMAEREWSRQ